MAAVAAANPIPTADLQSILLIAFLPTLHNKPLQKRRAHFVMNGGPKKGRSLRRACLPMAKRCWFAPSGDFGTSRFKGTYILRDLTRLRNKWFCPRT